MSKRKSAKTLQDDLQTIVSRATKIFVNPNPAKKKSFEEKVVGLEKMSGKASGFESLKPRSKPKPQTKKNDTVKKGKGDEGQTKAKPKPRFRKVKARGARGPQGKSARGGASLASSEQNRGGAGTTSMSS